MLWRPAFARYLHVRFTGLKHDLQQRLRHYGYDRTHTGRLTRGRIFADCCPPPPGSPAQPSPRAAGPLLRLLTENYDLSRRGGVAAAEEHEAAHLRFPLPELVLLGRGHRDQIHVCGSVAYDAAYRGERTLMPLLYEVDERLEDLGSTGQVTSTSTRAALPPLIRSAAGSIVIIGACADAGATNAKTTVTHSVRNATRSRTALLSIAPRRLSRLPLSRSN
jgi:hypothetical protein